MIKRILVALSGTQYTGAAIRHALELAGLHDAQVTGVTDVDLAKVANVGPVPMGGGAAASELMEHRLKLTVDGGYGFNEVTDFWSSSATGWRTDDAGQNGQIVVRGQLQVLF